MPTAPIPVESQHSYPIMVDLWRESHQNATEVRAVCKKFINPWGSEIDSVFTDRKEKGWRAAYKRHLQALRSLPASATQLWWSIWHHPHQGSWVQMEISVEMEQEILVEHWST